MTTISQPTTGELRNIVVISAGTSDPSSSRMLADRIAQQTLNRMRASGNEVRVSVIELRPLAAGIANAIVSGFPDEELQAAIDQLAAADAVIASTPVYKAGISGLFKAFVDIRDNDLLIAKPVVLAATAGSSRHALIVDEHMRPLFAFMRAFTVPNSIFAAPEDWADTALNGRIARAAAELVAMIEAASAPHRQRLVPVPAHLRRQRAPQRHLRRGRPWNGHRLRHRSHDTGHRRRPAGRELAQRSLGVRTLMFVLSFQAAIFIRASSM